MSIFEYNQEAHMKLVRQEGYDEGYDNGYDNGKCKGIVVGKKEDILEVLADLGDIPIELQEKISSQTDLQQLKKWIKLAAKAQSLEEFMVDM